MPGLLQSAASDIPGQRRVEECPGSHARCSLCDGHEYSRLINHTPSQIRQRKEGKQLRVEASLMLSSMLFMKTKLLLLCLDLFYVAFITFPLPLEPLKPSTIPVRIIGRPENDRAPNPFSSSRQSRAIGHFLARDNFGPTGCPLAIGKLLQTHWIRLQRFL